MRLIGVAAAIEAITGLALIVVPSVVAWLLFRAELTDAGLATARVAGCGLLALGAACRPDDSKSTAARSVQGLLIYNSFVSIFFAYLVVRGQLVGVLLWPALLLHVLLSALLVRFWRIANSQ